MPGTVDTWCEVALISCRDCGAIQRLPSIQSGRLECWQCGRALEIRTGRSIDAALACGVSVLLLLLPANFLTLMTVHIGTISSSSILVRGLRVAWSQGWPLVTIVLALEAVIFPFLRFGMLSFTLAAIRLGRRDKWLGSLFRYSELLDIWAMFDVLLIGAGIGYGRLASQISVTIGAGGWCLVAASFMTMITRATLERREVWRRVSSEPPWDGPGAISCTSCDLLLPPEKEGQRCPRCNAEVHRRYPFSRMQCAALLTATAALTPVAYGYPMSAFWKAGTPHPHTVINGIMLLFTHGFWYFGVVIFFVSVVFPLTKLASLAWFLTSVRRGSSWRLRFKTSTGSLRDWSLVNAGSLHRHGIRSVDTVRASRSLRLHGRRAGFPDDGLVSNSGNTRV